jgi:hypothetical protein
MLFARVSRQLCGQCAGRPLQQQVSQQHAQGTEVPYRSASLATTVAAAASAMLVCHRKASPCSVPWQSHQNVLCTYARYLPVSAGNFVVNMLDGLYNNK